MTLEPEGAVESEMATEPLKAEVTPLSIPFPIPYVPNTCVLTACPAGVILILFAGGGGDGGDAAFFRTITHLPMQLLSHPLNPTSHFFSPITPSRRLLTVSLALIHPVIHQPIHRPIYSFTQVHLRSPHPTLFYPTPSHSNHPLAR